MHSMDFCMSHSESEIFYINPELQTILGYTDIEVERLDGPLAIICDEYQDDFQENITTLQDTDAEMRSLSVELVAKEKMIDAVAIISYEPSVDDEHFKTSFLLLPGGGPLFNSILQDETTDNAPIGVTVADMTMDDEPLIYVNDRFCEMTGYGRSYFLGKNCRMLQGKDTREEQVQKIRNAISENESITVDLRNYRKNGEMFWNRLYLEPILNDSGQATHYLGYQQDVTAEKEYQDQFSLFKKHAENTQQIVLITDKNGFVEYVNPSFEEVTGYTKEEVIGKTPDVLDTGLVGEECHEEMVKEIESTGMWEKMITNKKKTGELFYVNQKVTPVENKFGEITHFVAIQEDVTNKKLRAQTLDVFDRVLRHNLRTTINVIDGYADLIEQDAGDETEEYIEIIRRQSKSMKNITEKIAKIRSVWNPDQAKKHWREIYITDLIEKYRNQYPNARILSSVAHESITVLHPELLAIAIDEAVENSIKHNTREDPTVHIRVQKSSAEEEITICIEDNGPGIPDVERNVINTGEETNLKHGSGIGLWIIEWVATTLGGEVKMSECESGGSSVSISIPTAD